MSRVVHQNRITFKKGVIAPILTPFNDDLSVATDLYADHAHRLIADGCVALAPFGTTGEALSVGMFERVAAVKFLIENGIPPSHLIPGTGLTSLTETAALSKGMLNLGCKAVMVLPPFYFKGVSEEGLYTYFAHLIEDIGPSARIVLYHIPQVAGVGLPVPLVARLRTDFPEAIVGIKDSSGDWANTEALLAIEGLNVWPGAELPLLEALERGAPGCISATANLNAASISEVILLAVSGKAALATSKHKTVKAIRQLLTQTPPIPTQKQILAHRTGDARWLNVRPPLTQLPEPVAPQLEAKLAALNG